MRYEVLISSFFGFSLLVTWIFYPVIFNYSTIYSQYLTFLGLKVTFMGSTTFIFLPLTLATGIFALFSSIIPLIWRKSRYSLYLSGISSILTLAMLISSYIYVLRYFHYSGYSVVPTFNGYFYMRTPITPGFGLPFFLLFPFLIFSVLNSATRARWLPYQRLTLLEKVYKDIMEGNLYKGLTNLFNELGVSYATTKESIDTGEFKIPLSERSEGSFFPEKPLIYFYEGKSFIYDGEEFKELPIDEGIKRILSMAKLDMRREEKEYE
ncbi:hypothetical protein CM19_01895 [Candidatus Acidianus copahuensis]|uniref:Uncharacterized protein n=1 Tax=Candidatus Acidianus copahuensis TaxID=1160895 RepID=A0A031LSB6_9CREN|nr:hypothetical protein [Candidatus Acidianus copahuensis]EZQ11277.1 hypothetical protein CM19_01895 [Candidatus Acidianus copahuensis]